MVVPNNHGFSYQKWTFWGVLGIPLFLETPIYSIPSNSCFQSLKWEEVYLRETQFVSSRFFFQWTPHCCQLVSNLSKKDFFLRDIRVASGVTATPETQAIYQHLPWFIIYIFIFYPEKNMSLFVSSMFFFPNSAGNSLELQEKKGSFNRPWWKSPHIKSCVCILTAFPIPRSRTIRLQHLRWGQSDKDPVGPSWKGGNSPFVSLKRRAPLKGKPI